MSANASSLAQLSEHREELEVLAEREDLRVSKYAEALLKTLDEGS